MMRLTGWQIVYDGNDSKTIAAVGYLDGQVVVLSSSVDVITQVTAPRSPWDRTKKTGDIQNIPRGASNVATAHMDKYHRHRRIVTPAFNQDLHRQVWDESLRAFSDLGDSEGWSGQSMVRLPHLQTITGKFTLMVIGKVGFGIGSSSEDAKSLSLGERSLRDTFVLTAENPLIRTLVPSWMFRLPIDRLRRIKKADEYLMSTMHNQIEGRRAENAALGATGRQRDIFNYLIDANEDESSVNTLSDDEVLSNTFIMLFAVHETASRALTCTLGLLACNPEEQAKLYESIQETLTGDRLPTFDDFDSLRQISDCIMESLRLFSVAPLILRRATEDAQLRIPGIPEPVMLPKGTLFAGDIVGINYDPARFPDPRTFRPSRWATKAELKREDYISFGNGLHMCLGRRFALYEMVCFLTLVLRTWKVVPELRPGETVPGWRERVLDRSVKMSILMGPGDVPVRLERR